MKKPLQLILALLLAAAIGAAVWWWSTTGPADHPSPSTAEEQGSEQTEKPPYEETPEEDPTKAPPAAIEQSLPAVSDIAIAGHPQVGNASEARKVLDQQQEILGLGEGSVLEIASSSRDDYGNDYYQVEQRYKGIPIRGSRANLEVEQGRAQVLSGVWIKNLQLDTEPTYDAATALRQALDDRGVPAERNITLQGEPELLVFIGGRQAYLCWRMRATLSNPDTAPEDYLVDAHQPKILLQQDGYRH